MSKAHVILCVLALLSIYAVAARLDELAASGTDDSLAQLDRARCARPTRHRAARPADAPSAATHAAQAACGAS